LTQFWKNELLRRIQHGNYKKWLRYFLDFRTKCPVPEARPEQVRLFIDKLREKKQTPSQQKQAAHAISLYFETLCQDHAPLQEIKTTLNSTVTPKPPQVREGSSGISKSIPPKILSSAFPAQR
jgi:hypothetical protein